MGFTKLNIWLRDEKCRPYKIQTPLGDRIFINNCMGERVKLVPDIPVGEAHVEVEVPPGCYVVQGHVCEHGTNDYTDKAIVIAGCNQELCVNLIVPQIRTCAVRDLHPIVREARRLGLPEVDTRITARTILAVGRISRHEMIGNMEKTIEVTKGVKGTEEVIKEYHATLDIIRE